MRSDGPGMLVALLGGLALGFATPPAIAPFAEFLVLPALMIWYSLATAGNRPLLCSYLYGCVHMAWFSWSVHHVMFGAYVAIVVVGGLYYLGATAAVRALPARLQPLAFAVMVAASFWLRATMPEIHYPHGQPCHCLWQWPVLLGSVSLGGEPLANALLAGLAAAAVLVVRSWRTAVPRWSAAWLSLVGSLVVVAALTLWGSLNNRLAFLPKMPDPVRITAIEPGYHPDEISDLPPDEWVKHYRELVEKRLVEPTRRELARPEVADLILWPESSVLDEPLAEHVESGRIQMNPWRLPASTARLVVGAAVLNAVGSSPSALLVELPSGRVLQHHDKRRLVPGGEFVPLLGLLPKGLADWVRDVFADAMGAAPASVPGQLRPPMQTAAGVPFAALLCYDNAFPGPAAEQVAAGARLLVVLSNEAWYRGGGELTQLVAMTVIRALETATPLVRCTQDGWSVAVSGHGEILAQLEQAPAPQPSARILRVSVVPGWGRLAPMAWLRQLFGPICGALLGLALALAALRWVRLRAASSAVSAVPGSGPSGPGIGGS